MLASAITYELGLPPPKYIHANDIIGGVKDPRIYPQVPRLVMSHSIPPMILKSAFFRRLTKLPRYVLLVRDCRASLVSNYDKWKKTYNCNFSEYLRGDMKGHRFNNDIWWCVRYYNAWGPIVKKFPEVTLVVKYEDLGTDSLHELQRINKFWGLQLKESSLIHGINESSKKKMELKTDPTAPGGIIRKDNRTIEDCYNDGDKRFLDMVFQTFLKDSFDYSFSW